LNKKDKTISIEELGKIITIIPKMSPFKSWRAALNSEETQLLFKLIYFCALRNSEIIILKKSDFDLDNKLLQISRLGKKETTTIPPNLIGELKTYLKDKKDDDYLFVSRHNGRRLTRQIIWVYFKEAGELANLELFKARGTHIVEGMITQFFRDSHKRYMLREGADPDLVDLKLRKFSHTNYGNYKLKDLLRWEKSHYKEILSEEDIQNNLEWYKNNRYIYEDLSNEAKRIVEKNLNLKGIAYHNIYPRIKSLGSFETKIRKGIHYLPKNMQDLAGVRIICYVKSDVDKVCDIIESNFNIDANKTKNREKILSENKMGYSSIQYVCKLPNLRTKLSENLHLSDRLFEIQVRTILQHAWAEIEHDDLYKNSNKLSGEIKRQFYLVSSILESADNELERLHDKAK